MGGNNQMTRLQSLATSSRLALSAVALLASTAVPVNGLAIDADAATGGASAAPSAERDIHSRIPPKSTPGTSVQTQSQLASPAPTTWTHNICGAVCNWNTAVALDAIKWFAAAEPTLAYAYGTQETCAAQYTNFRDWLVSNESSYFVGHFRSQTQTTSCGGTIQTPQQFGVGVYARNRSGTITRESGGFAIQAPSDGETRGYACMRTTISLGPYWTCTTHVTPENWGSGYYRDAQSMQYLGAIEGKAPTRVFASGDMYRTPSRLADLGYNYYAHSEADNCYAPQSAWRWTHRNTSSGNLETYDYAFKSYPAQSICPQDAFLYPASSSDMWPVGTFRSDHRLKGGYQPF